MANAESKKPPNEGLEGDPAAAPKKAAPAVPNKKSGKKALQAIFRNKAFVIG